MGIVINKPLGVSLEEIFSALELPLENSRLKEKVVAGGPVQSEHGFILHKPEGSWESTLSISDGFALTTSQDVLTAIGEGCGPTRTTCGKHVGWINTEQTPNGASPADCDNPHTATGICP